MDKLPLREVFLTRENRFRLLEAGFAAAGWTGDTRYLLETGCADGAAARHMARQGGFYITAIDVDDGLFPPERADENVELVRADICRTPFDNGSFDGIFSEAAFSVLPDKEAAVREYARVLKKNGRVLIDDFALKTGAAPVTRDVQGVPCLDGVQTMETYRELFARQGFRCIYSREHFSEFIRMAIGLAKFYGVSPSEVGRTIVSAFGKGGGGDEFFSNTRMTYCQMIFEKE